MIAGVFVNDFGASQGDRGVPPPWSCRSRGTGGRLLRHVQLKAAADGITRMGLATPPTEPGCSGSTPGLGSRVTHTSFIVVIGETSVTAFS